MPAGLSSSEAKAGLRTYGYNELPSARPKNILKIAAETIREPMFLLLISCAVLYMILGDYQEGIIMLGTIFIIIFISFFQHRKTERALEALKNLASPRALVIRDGIEVRIPGREVVPDDLLILNEGDRIAADAILLESIHLSVDESLLTGESVAVTKTVGNDPASNKTFSGTMVVQGSGIAKVVSTGIKTEFGKIGVSLKAIEEDETRLQKEMKTLIRNLFLIGIGVSIAIVVVFYISRGNFLQSLLNGLAASMAVLPEEFPVVLTVFLALGAWRLSKIKVLTRRPSAIETLGSATVLCSDKTGTITQNKMEVAVLYDGDQMYYGDSFYDNHQQTSLIVKSAHHASRFNSIDPMEIAISESHDKFYPNEKEDVRLVKEYPFTRESMAMTRVMQDENETEYSVFAKGAPESIFSLCKLSTPEVKKHTKAIEEMAGKGYRVIAVAGAKHDDPLLPEKQTAFDFTFSGLIGLADPIRPEVPKAIKECQSAGVKVIMITGDYPVTAKSIAEQIGLPAVGKIITGDELNKMSDDELKKNISGVNVFARVVPHQKLRIVQALKANDEIVAMTGDGVNDAPALKAANIGVAMGNKGTDVAREASSLVLLDDNFTSIVSAIRSGRRIYDNLQKAMSYILAIHIPIIGLTLMPAFFPTLPILLMPLHIIFMELIIDPVCSVAFETEQEEKGIMNRPPRKPGEDFFGFRKIMNSFLSGLLLLLMVIGVYFLSVYEQHTEGEVRAIAFSALIIGNIFLILTNLSKTRPVLSVLAERNITVIGLLMTAFIMLQLILFVPALRQVFSFEFPGYHHFLPSIVGALIMVTILEVIKLLKRKSKHFIPGN
jgi:Ca2+-transporting ATPase